MGLSRVQKDGKHKKKGTLSFTRIHDFEYWLKTTGGNQSSATEINRLNC
jgi:hypothetical protein